MNEADVKHMLINPYYAINIDPHLAEEHPPLVEKDMWIQTNLNLIDELGAEKWLDQLLTVLQGAAPSSPNDSTPADDRKAGD